MRLPPRRRCLQCPSRGPRQARQGPCEHQASSGDTAERGFMFSRQQAIAGWSTRMFFLFVRRAFPVRGEFVGRTALEQPPTPQAKTEILACTGIMASHINTRHTKWYIPSLLKQNGKYSCSNYIPLPSVLRTPAVAALTVASPRALRPPPTPAGRGKPSPQTQSPGSCARPPLARSTRCTGRRQELTASPS